jgi:hypothetical protein
MTSRRAALLTLFLSLALSATTGTASADERILSFVSDVTVNKDASLTVVETIRVRAEGRAIKRGIVREFPTDYRDRGGTNFRVGFEVLSVRRDGQEEAFHIENVSNGKAIYIGQADHILQPGTYAYEISYRTTRQIRHDEESDELYWNVTGTGWRLPIDFAETLISLPHGADAQGVSGYTGAQGEDGKAFEIVEQAPGFVHMRTTSPLRAQEGFTVALSWPMGLVARPSARDQAANFASDNISTAIALLGLALVLGYYGYVWHLFGRDPESGTIFARFEPPQGFSPAATRFVSKMRYDRTAFSAALINMAVKGFLIIEESGSDFTLRKVGTNVDQLSKGERRIASRLLGTVNSIVLENDNHKEIGKAINSFRESLEGEYQKKYFVTNAKYFYVGAALTVAIVAATILSANNRSPETLFMGLWLTGWTVGIAFLGLRVARAWAAVRRGLGSNLLNIAAAIGLTLFSIPFFGAEVVVGFLLKDDMNFVSLFALAGLILANAAFYFLLKAPTRMGRTTLDEIEGFKHFLSVAEQNRLDKLHPPEKTPELFEKFLPYALALDVENEWSEQFADVLSAAAVGQTEYQPHWYRGTRWLAVLLPQPPLLRARRPAAPGPLAVVSQAVVVVAAAVAAGSKSVPIACLSPIRAIPASVQRQGQIRSATRQ